MYYFAENDWLLLIYLDVTIAVRKVFVWGKRFPSNLERQL